MENGTAGARRTDQETDAALWRERAERQARRADRLADVIDGIFEAIGGVLTHEFEQENDDRLFCEDCGRRGWPEDGFHTVVHDEVGRLDFCPDHWEATA